MRQIPATSIFLIRLVTLLRVPLYRLFADRKTAPEEKV